ncbi:MAG TPA: DUF3887 domain-containing protein, partial [Thermotogaceae bacterium]|nr:DUF3887 domain-containing protein [Thermotogaceae bacterium]
MKNKSILVISMLLLLIASLFANNVSDIAMEYLKYLFNENYFAAYEMQTFEMRSQFNVDKMKELITNIKTQFGRFKKMYYLKQEEREGYIFNIFRADYEKYSLMLTVAV